MSKLYRVYFKTQAVRFPFEEFTQYWGHDERWTPLARNAILMARDKAILLVEQKNAEYECVGYP